MANIHNYTFKPEPVICYANGEDPRKTLTFGFELEVDRNIYNEAEKELSAGKVIEMGAGRVYCKQDSSLAWGGREGCRGSGYEIVSHPGSLRHICYEMHITGIVNKARKSGFKSHDAGTCGLHVHVGRLAMGDTPAEQDDTIRKVTFLVARHWDDIKTFTRRTAGQLAAWAANPATSDAQGHGPLIENFNRNTMPDVDAIRTYNTHNERYYAVNCENDATMELRIFRGTLKRDTLISSIQFSSNLVQYAMAHTWEECVKSTFADVAQFVHYRDLDAYLELRGLCTDSTQDVNHGGLSRRISSHQGADGITAGYDAENDSRARRAG